MVLRLSSAGMSIHLYRTNYGNCWGWTIRYRGVLVDEFLAYPGTKGGAWAEIFKRIGAWLAARRESAS